MERRHIAFVGGSETLGRWIPEPYPSLLEQELSEVCVNFAQANASVDACLHDTLIPKACADAALTVLAVTGAHSVSNRLYSVHPRRNDRFLKPSSLLRRLYPEVDFTDICFTRHLLKALYQASPERFKVVREELQAAWSARMRTFIDRVGPRVLLVWFAAEPRFGGDAAQEKQGRSGGDPPFVTTPMIAKLRPLVRDVVMVRTPDRLLLSKAPDGAESWELATHQSAADALREPIRAALIASAKAAA